jgi:hypothetical protein
MALDAFGDPPGLFGRVVDRVEDRRCPCLVGRTGRRQLDLAGAADEEVDPEFTLELADLLRQRGWAMCRRSAARPKCSSSATARK